jgi:V/A-type H+/Na+-transporting ATPase subunit E
MTIDEKIDEFYKSVIDDAANQSEKLIKEYEASLSNIYENHIEDTKRKAAITLRLETENLIKEKNKRISVETIHIKRHTSEKINELIEILFSDVSKKLETFMKTDAYSFWLIKEIKKVILFSRGEKMTVYINTSDSDKKAFLEEKTGIELTISTTNFLGGIRAVIHSKNILIDNSFATKISEEKDNFTLL